MPAPLSSYWTIPTLTWELRNFSMLGKQIKLRCLPVICQNALSYQSSWEKIWNSFSAALITLLIALPPTKSRSSMPLPSPAKSPTNLHDAPVYHMNNFAPMPLRPDANSVPCSRCLFILAIVSSIIFTVKSQGALLTPNIVYPFMCPSISKVCQKGSASKSTTVIWDVSF